MNAHIICQQIKPTAIAHLQNMCARDIAGKNHTERKGGSTNISRRQNKLCNRLKSGCSITLTATKKLTIVGVTLLVHGSSPLSPSPLAHEESHRESTTACTICSMSRAVKGRLRSSFCLQHVCEYDERFQRFVNLHGLSFLPFYLTLLSKSYKKH